ncbi:MAG TPA: energy transducer TonB [Candidatus Acidoferrales bacterium]|jgi:TonB family protein|nr:energy transducer TonB [Candidatus Acidoferrales bacterium]
MIRFITVFSLAVAIVFVSESPASANTDEPSPSPTGAHWKFENPFCEVRAGLVPVESAIRGTEYLVQLYASHGTRVSAHVTLIGAEGAYDASVPPTNLSGAPDDRRTDGIVIKMPQTTPIHYFFVDSFTIDGEAPYTCPSYVAPSGSGPSEDAIGGLGLTNVTATFLQALPDLPCGRAYIPPSSRKGYEPIVGHYGDKPRSTVLHVYIDSAGNALRATVSQSSGVEGLDDAAMAAAEYTKYNPAQFLCQPVVGELDMQMDYSVQ